MATIILNSDQLAALNAFYSNLAHLAGLAQWSVPANLGASLGGLLAGASAMVSLTEAERDALSPQAGDVIWNSTDETLQFYDGDSWQTIGEGTGSVTSVGTGDGLQGGPITTTGLIELNLSSDGGLESNLGEDNDQLGIKDGGVTNDMLENDSLSITVGAGLSGGGSVTLGGSSPALTIDSTVATLTGSQILTNKTLTAPVVNGLTSTGSTAINFGGNSGAQSSTTGAQTLQGSSYAFNSAWTKFGWSMVEWAKTNSVNLINAGSFTVGQRWWFTTPVTIAGIKFYWAGGAGARTVKVQVWDPAGVSQFNSNVSVNAAGEYSVACSVPVLAANVNKDWIFSAWENSGNYYTNSTTAACVPGAGTSALSFMASPYAWPQDLGNYSAGDAKPALNNLTQYFPVEPIYTIP